MAVPGAWEKRGAIRRNARQSVAILQSDGTLVCECDLVDVSDTGGRLRLRVPDGETPPQIMPEFILSLSRRGNIFRQCETVWQRDGEVGVRFIRPTK